MSGGPKAPALGATERPRARGLRPSASPAGRWEGGASCLGEGWGAGALSSFMSRCVESRKSSGRGLAEGPASAQRLPRVPSLALAGSAGVQAGRAHTHCFCCLGARRASVTAWHPAPRLGVCHRHGCGPGHLPVVGFCCCSGVAPGGMWGQWGCWGWNPGFPHRKSVLQPPGGPLVPTNTLRTSTPLPSWLLQPLRLWGGAVPRCLPGGAYFALPAGVPKFGWEKVGIPQRPRWRGIFCRPK